jgi:hypothetical protein
MMTTTIFSTTNRQSKMSEPTKLKPGRKKGSKNKFKITERPENPEQLPAYRITPRDLEVIHSVYTHRLLTSEQILALHFASPALARSRLRRMFQYRLLWRTELPTKPTEGRRPLVYFLDEKGAECLFEHYDLEPEDLDWDKEHNSVSDPFIEHLIKTNEVRISFEIAARQHSMAIEKWLDDKTLKSKQQKDYVTITGPQGGKHKTAIVPDGYFYIKLDEKKYSHNFLEVDRATVVGMYSQSGRRDWARKVRAYLAYYHQGFYQKRYGTKSMRVLTVTTGEKRLQNLKAITEQAGGRGRFWFTTFDQVTSEKVLTEPIWHKAGSKQLHSLTV